MTWTATLRNTRSRRNCRRHSISLRRRRTSRIHKEATTDIFSRWRHRSLQAEDVDVIFVSASTFEALSVDAIIMKMGTAELRIPSVSSIVALKLHAMKNNPDRFGKDAPDILELMKRQPTNLNPAAVKQLCSRFGTPELWSKLEHLFP